MSDSAPTWVPRLLPGEPPFGPWRWQSWEELARRLEAAATASRARRTARPGPAGQSMATGPLVVAVDGRSASGKTTVACALAGLLPSCALVHTDDVAWYLTFFGWDELLISRVLAPATRGEAVSFRPDSWVERGRDGSIDVPAGTRVLLVEGVGASRQSLQPFVDVSAWVQSDVVDARAAGVARDVALGREPRAAAEFWDVWDAEEVPFLARDRPWERAELVLSAGLRREGLVGVAERLGS